MGKENNGRICDLHSELQNAEKLQKHFPPPFLENQKGELQKENLSCGQIIYLYFHQNLDLNTHNLF